MPKCSQCGSAFTYEDGAFYVCPECAHEWDKNAAEEAAPAGRAIREPNGNELHDGDTVTVIKDLKVKGTSLGVKVGFALESATLVETAANFLRQRRIDVHIEIRHQLLDYRMGGTHSLRSMLISSRSGQTDDSQPLESPQWSVGNAVLL